MSSGGPIDQGDIQHWKNKLNNSIETKAWNSANKGPDAQPWKNGFFSCFSPASLCCLTCCLPCVTFGRTHHRLHKNGDMTGYEPINTSCLLFYLSGCVGGHFILNAMQLQDIREKHNLQGSCAEDLLKSFCCLCCSVMQAEKESKDRVGQGHVVEQQYAGETMIMGQGGQAPAEPKF